MIELHYWPTSNGQKIAIFLEEAGLAYETHPVNIGKDEQFRPEFLKISPNNRIPAIVDREPADGGEPLSVFESGAILLYLARKTGRFMPTDPRALVRLHEWLFWQVGGLGPMAGQANHFNRSAPEKVPYAIERYVNETNRLYGVLDGQLERFQHVADNQYTIADMACYPWVVNHAWQNQTLDEFPNVKRWFEGIQSRPAVQRAYEKGAAVRQAG